MDSNYLVDLINKYDLDRIITLPSNYVIDCEFGLDDLDLDLFLLRDTSNGDLILEIYEYNCDLSYFLKWTGTSESFMSFAEAARERFGTEEEIILEELLNFLYSHKKPFNIGEKYNLK